MYKLMCITDSKVINSQDFTGCIRKFEHYPTKRQLEDTVDYLHFKTRTLNTILYPKDIHALLVGRYVDFPRLRCSYEIRKCIA